MKEYDRVELIRDRAEYLKRGVKKGDRGVILGGERSGYFLVYFDGEIVQEEGTGAYCSTEIGIGVPEKDLRVLDEW